MKILDLFQLSLSSLWKRKVRTVLTVLGVMIGTTSIVVMLSLGLGLSKASMAEVEQYGGITTVTVTEQGSMYGGGMMTGDSEEEIKETTRHLDDSVIRDVLQIAHVKDVYPMLETDVLAMCNSYQSSLFLKGVPVSKMPDLGLKLSQGSLPSAEDTALKFVYGNAVLADFYNEKTGQGYWWNGEVANIDLMKDTMMIVFDQDAYFNFLWGADEGQAKMPKKHVVETAAIMEGGLDDYSTNSSYVYCDLEKLKTILKKEFKNKVISGQPTTQTGKPLKEIYYTSLMVNVDDMNHVKEVQKELNMLGFVANSNAEWVESIQSEFKYIQLALGGIGAVALLVAAIGITNTMMMSIYERTKEIGIMKVLGCDMRHIQIMFLTEAGFIGLIGGVVGLLLSYALSIGINYLVKHADLGMPVQYGISYIPLWLSGLSLIFAIVVGMVAGFFPSLRAMKLSPLAAIRNE